ncbi:MAG: phage tail tape measure protein, partial [bacterium]|nr:phage tail tape measure protein [bacterium]
MNALADKIADFAQEAVQQMYEFAKGSDEAFRSFDTGTREIFTLLPDASAEFRDQLSDDVKSLSAEIGVLPEEVLPAVYNALSAGIPADNVIDNVRVASEAARAGVSDLESTLTLGVSVLNAQVGGVDSLSDVYDQLFFTVKNGVVTMPELNEVMSAVTSVAGEAGVSMQDISSAMIVMTRQGDSAAEASELLSTMLTQLSTSGTTLANVFQEAAGKSFRDFIAEGGNLAGAMELLQEHADSTGTALGDMLGGGSPFFRDTQAARGALELTGKHLQELSDFSAEAEMAMGSMGEAAAEMGEAAVLNSEKAAASWEVMKIAVGESGSGLADTFYEVKTTLAEGVVEELKASEVKDTYTAAISDMNLTLKQQREYLEQATGGHAMMTSQWYDGDIVAERLEATIQLLNDGYQGSAQDLGFLVDETIRANKEASDQALIQQAVTDVFVEHALALDTTQSQLEKVAWAEEELAISSRQTAEIIVEDKADESEAIFQTWTMAVAAKDAMVKDSEEIQEVSAARSAAIVAAQEAETAAIMAGREAYNGYALSALESGEATANWTDELFKSAAQGPINQEQLLLLAV